MAPLTITDLAKQANVSIKTISRVINNEAGVGAKKRAEIQKIIEDLGFVPNAAARAMAGAKSYQIGLLLIEAINHYYPHELQVGAMRGCRARGFHLGIDETRNFQNDIPAFRQRLRMRNYDGLILVPPLADDAVLMSLIEELKIPFVRIAPVTEVARAPYVYIDDVQAGYDMTRYLIEHGHRSIAFLQNAAVLISSDLRRKGYVRAMEEAGYTIDPQWSGFRTEAFSGAQFEEAERLVTLADRPSAIFAAADSLAFSAIAAAYKNGLRVPDDLTVVGFDDSPGCQSIWPPLTTVHQPIAAMAETGVNILIDIIDGARKPDGIAAKLSYHIVERASVKTQK